MFKKSHLPYVIGLSVLLFATGPAFSMAQPNPPENPIVGAGMAQVAIQGAAQAACPTASATCTSYPFGNGRYNCQCNISSPNSGAYSSLPFLFGGLSASGGPGVTNATRSATIANCQMVCDALGEVLSGGCTFQQSNQPGPQ